MKCISCLEKIFPSTNPTLIQTKYSMLANEKFSFQVAFKSSQTGVVEMRIKSELQPYLKMYTVELAPSIVSKMADSDDYVIYSENSSTLYPDILMQCPGAIKDIFSSGITTGGLAAIVSNMFIRIKE